MAAPRHALPGPGRAAPARLVGCACSSSAVSEPPECIRSMACAKRRVVGSTTSLSRTGPLVRRNGGRLLVTTSPVRASSASMRGASPTNRPCEAAVWTEVALNRRQAATVRRIVVPAPIRRVDADGAASGDVADDQFSADHALAAVLLGEGRGHRAAERGGQAQPEAFRPLDPSRIGRDHHDLPAGQQRQEVGDEQAGGLQVLGAAAERVLVRRQICARRGSGRASFRRPRTWMRRSEPSPGRVPWSGGPSARRPSKARWQSRSRRPHPSGADEEQQPAQLVAGALFEIP